MSTTTTDPRRSSARLLALLGLGGALLAVPVQAGAQGEGVSKPPAVAGLKVTAISANVVQLTWLVADGAYLERVKVRRAALNAQGEPMGGWIMVGDFPPDRFPENVERTMNLTDQYLQASTTYLYEVELVPLQDADYLQYQAPLLSWSARRQGVKMPGSAPGPAGVVLDIGLALAKQLGKQIINGNFLGAVPALGEWYKLQGSDLWQEIKKQWPGAAADLEASFAALEQAFWQQFDPRGLPSPTAGKLVPYAKSYLFPEAGRIVIPHDSVSRPLHFHVKGDTPVTITRIDYPDPPFYVGSRAEWLGRQFRPDTLLSISARFQPSSEGEYRDKLTIHSNTGSVTVELSGRCARSR